MADFALLRNPGGGVIRTRGPLKILQVAGHTGRRGQVVVPIRVALRAGYLYVRACQRKWRLRMVKGRRLPGGSRMTDLALLRDPGRHVIRIRRPLEILQVARHACRGGDVEIAVRVALVALQLRVSTGEREADRIVIETGWLPRGG